MPENIRRMSAMIFVQGAKMDIGILDMEREPRRCRLVEYHNFLSYVKETLAKPSYFQYNIFDFNVKKKRVTVRQEAAEKIPGKW